MPPDPFDGYHYLLSYELKDDPSVEHEEWVSDMAEARAHLRGKADMVAWASLTDHEGETIADTQVLV